MRAKATAKSSPAVLAMSACVRAEGSSSIPPRCSTPWRRAGAPRGSSLRQAPVERAARRSPRSSCGDRLDVLLPGVREEGARAPLVEPVDLPLADEEDPAQHQLGHALRVRLGVGERQRAAPRAAEDLPPLDAEVLAQRLDVGDQVPRRVVDERRVRRALAAAALVEEHDAVRRGIEEAPVARLGAEAGAAVQEDDGLAAAGCRSPRSRARARRRRAGARCGSGSMGG